jgi:hypothetical protein
MKIVHLVVVRPTLSRSHRIDRRLLPLSVPPKAQKLTRQIQPELERRLLCLLRLLRRHRPEPCQRHHSLMKAEAAP